MSKRKSNNRQLGRRENTREERKVKEDLPKMLFSFKDFDKTQIPPGQTYEDWQTEELLAYALEKFGHICQLDRNEAVPSYIKIYGDFPINSDFTHPKHIANDVKWAVVLNIKGQKGRLAGHIMENVFYVVFLDKDHRFYPSVKKNT